MAAKPRSSLKKRWPLIILVAVLLLVLGLVISRLQWVEEEIDLGPTQEALRNPFLASQRLLEEYGVDFEMQNGFSGLPLLQEAGESSLSPADTLILINTFQSLHEHQVERLWQWVESGGRLIVSLENPSLGAGAHLNDPLLTRMNLELEANAEFYLGDPSELQEDTDEPEATPEDEQQQIADDPQQFICTWGQSTVSARFNEQEPELGLGVSGDTHLSGADGRNQVLAGDEDAAFLVKRKVGAGEIYAITSAIGWRNSHIGCADNAYAFSRLTADSNKVWYALNLQTPSFWRYLWQLTSVGCIAILLALAAWLWTRATRFGPIFTQPHTRRRPFIEHVDASAQFMLRHGGHQALIDILRRDIAQRAERRHPGFGRLTRKDKVSTLQTLSAVDAQAIDTALFHSPPQSAVEFLEVVKRLQQLRNQL